jgi:hypothetical protein
MRWPARLGPSHHHAPRWDAGSVIPQRQILRAILDLELDASDAEAVLVDRGATGTITSTGSGAVAGEAES